MDRGQIGNTSEAGILGGFISPRLDLTVDMHLILNDDGFGLIPNDSRWKIDFVDFQRKPTRLTSA